MRDVNGVGWESGELAWDKLSMMSMKDGDMSSGVFAWELMLVENGRKVTESELGVRGDWWPVCKSTRVWYFCELYYPNTHPIFLEIFTVYYL